MSCEVLIVIVCPCLITKHNVHSTLALEHHYDCKSYYALIHSHVEFLIELVLKKHKI